MMIDTNFILPMSPMMASQKQEQLQNVNGQGSFKDVLDSMAYNVADTERVDNEGVIEVATATSDQLHALTIASTQATTALELFVQVRNKAHDAYSEIMRMSV